MNETLTAGALLTSLLLGACATPAPPPAALVEARSTLQNAELDPKVLANAPLELKKATDSLNRANALHAKGEATDQVNSAAYVANQQARTAMAIARTKDNESAIRGAELDRERARADTRSIEAQRAQAQTTAAQAQTGAAREQAAAAEQRASGAEQRATGAEQRASGAEQQSAAAQASAIESRRRADAVNAALVGMCLSAQRAESVGYGEQFPIADNSTDTNRALNRRVEVYIAENSQPVRSRR